MSDDSVALSSAGSSPSRSLNSELIITCAAGPVASDKKGRRNVSVSFNDFADVTEFDPNECSTFNRPLAQFDLSSIDGMTKTTAPVKKKYPEYQHSARIKSLSPKRELRRAIVKARLLCKQVLLRDDALPELDEPELGYRRGILKSAIDDPNIVETASARYQGAVRKFLVDSGCPLDLLASDDLTEQERKFVKTACRGITLHTANGFTKAKSTLSLSSDLLSDPIEAYLLESTPNVISMGYRCMELGYSFIWRGWQRPYLVCPNGKKIELEVMHNVPYLPETSFWPSGSTPQTLYDCAVGTKLDPSKTTIDEADSTSVPVEVEPPLEATDGAKEYLTLRNEAKSLRHLMTHLPFNKYCTTCQRAKMEGAKHFRGSGIAGHEAKQFGDHVTADTLVLHGLKDRGFRGEKNAIMFYDFATEYHECIPVKSRKEGDTDWAFRHYIGPSETFKLKRMYCDRAPELINSARKHASCDDYSIPGDPRSNGIAENKVKLVLRGARALLRQAGLPAKYWVFAVRAFCAGLNFENRSSGKSSWERRHGTKFMGLRLPFGCIVDYYPLLNRPAPKVRADSKQDDEPVVADTVVAPGLSDVDQDLEATDDEGEGGGKTEDGNKPEGEYDSDNPNLRRPKFASTSIPGIFLGWEFQSGGKYDGVYVVANLNDLRRGKAHPRIDRIPKLYVDPDEGYVFPMRKVYDHLTRSVTNSHALTDKSPVVDSNTGGEAVDAANSYTGDVLDFRFDSCDDVVLQGGRKLAKHRRDPESTYADYWEFDQAGHRWIQHHISWRKQVYVPTGDDGGPTWRDLEDCRITELSFSDGTKKTITEKSILNTGRRKRLGQWWTGSSIFFLKGKAPAFADKILQESNQFLSKPMALRDSTSPLSFKSPVLDTLQRPSSLGYEDWRDMNSDERKGYVEAEQRLHSEIAIKENDPSSSGLSTNEVARIHEELDEPADIKTDFLDAGGEVLSVVNTKHAKYFPCLPKKDQHMWPFIRKVISRDHEGKIIRELDVKHQAIKGSTSSSSKSAGSDHNVAMVSSFTKVQHKREKITVRKRDKHASGLGKYHMPAKSFGKKGSNGLFLASSCRAYEIAPRCSQELDTGLDIFVPDESIGVFKSMNLFDLKQGLVVTRGCVGSKTSAGVFTVYNPTTEPILVKPGFPVAMLSVEKLRRHESLIYEEIPYDGEDEGNASEAPSRADVPSASATRAPSQGGATPVCEIDPLPLREHKFKHRPRQKTVFFYSACVAKSISKREAKLLTRKGADGLTAWEALSKEWKKLEDQGCWDIKGVRSMRKVKAESEAQFRKSGDPKDKAHFGAIFDICVEKNSELPDGDPNKKFKGRVVFEGCSVKDEVNNWAIFAEIASCPATMQAAKAADAYGLIDGHSVECADGESAYTQASFVGTPTWIIIRDQDRWPDEWFHTVKTLPNGKKFRTDPKIIDPVCPLIKALYGHPDSGGYWEKHCEENLRRIGFHLIHDAWKSVFWHPDLKLMLVVYVDDFKLSGPRQHIKLGWDLIGGKRDWKGKKSEIKMGTAGPVGRFLGCHHDEAYIDGPSVFLPREGWSKDHPPKKPAPDMYLGKPNPKVPLKDLAPSLDAEGEGIEAMGCLPAMSANNAKNWAQAKTDFLAKQINSGLTSGSTGSEHMPNEPVVPDGLLATPSRVKSAQGNNSKIRFMKYNMKDFLQSCIDRYIELGGNRIKEKLKICDTPFLDESKPEFDENPIMKDGVLTEATSGVLGDIACAVLMKILYAARMGRYDLIRPVAALASKVTKWTYLCDRKLHRLVCYIHSSLDLYMYAWVGDPISELELVLFCDADLAGDRTDAKSTSGVFLCIAGPRSFVPLTGVSKKQTSISRSTPEAEIVAMAHGLFKEAIPAIGLWEVVLQKKVQIRLLEDNEASCRVVITGRNPSMRHMSRTQRIDVSSINDIYSKGLFFFVNCPTEFQAADIFTKHCIDKATWQRNLMLIGHFTPGYLTSLGNIVACVAHLGDDSNEVILCAVADLPTTDSTIDKFIADVKGTSILDEHRCYVSLDDDRHYDRTIVEYCCGSNSRLGKRYAASKGCRVIRITQGLNATSIEGKFLASKGCVSKSGLLFASIPCTGGCPFNHFNGRTVEGAARIRAHVRRMIPLFRNFVELCTIARRCGNFICLEWPAGCSYWNRKDVQRLLETFGLTVVRFNGCRVKLTDSHGNLLSKPWKFATDCPGIVRIFERLKCQGGHAHATTEGKSTKGTEDYTYDMVRLIHEGFHASL